MGEFGGFNLKEMVNEASAQAPKPAQKYTESGKFTADLDWVEARLDEIGKIINSKGWKEWIKMSGGNSESVNKKLSKSIGEADYMIDQLWDELDKD